ncbi:MAG TPA: HlyD family type I secretion periplasmic adaptor subunit [Xanthobacteraceae bacterium]|nr:HlyD family type I secretion periplasmic adaptor subunit [Xanthobacteraceae bacterium]
MNRNRSEDSGSRIAGAVGRPVADEETALDRTGDEFRGVHADRRAVAKRTSNKLAPRQQHNALQLVTADDVSIYKPASNARRPIFIGAIIIVVMFFGFGTWAALAPIGSAAIAPGTVVEQIGRQTVQHLEGGIVKQILVQEGDQVKAGQPLIRLDETRPKAELELIQGELDLAQATQARLIAERDGQRRPQYPAELLARAKTDPHTAATIDDQNTFFKARAAVLNGQKSILQQQIAQYDQQINGFNAIKNAKATQLKLVHEELGDISGLAQEGYVTKSRVLALQREAGQLAGDRGQAMAEMARARQGIGESRRQILQVDKQRQEDVSKELDALAGQLSDLTQKQVAANDVVSRLDIVSPIAGTVTNLAVHTVGGVISPGSALMEIVPANGRLVVEAEVNPIDVNAIAVGDEVSIRVFVAGGRLTPTIFGRLDDISADRITVPNSNRSYYKARVSISPAQAARLGNIKLKVGMPVEAMISTGQQTALHYVVKPLLDSITRSFREH